MAQWAQQVRAKGERFQMFDYGCGWFSCPNMEYYGQKSPPAYDLSRINIPLALYAGSDDFLADPTDFAELVKALPAEYVRHKQISPSLEHLSFVWSYDLILALYD